MIQKEEFHKALNHPKLLEKMYENDKINFKILLKEMYEEYPDNLILEVWHVRLYGNQEKESKFTFTKEFKYTILFAAIAGFTTRLIYYFISQFGISEINYLFGVVPFIGALFMFNKQISKKLAIILSSIILVIIIYFNILPNTYSDNIVITYLHLPVLLWVILGYTFVIQEYRNQDLQLSYLRFNGEFLLLYMFFAISGMILSGITMQLFSYINLDIFEFYFENIILVGASSLAVFASYLVINELKIAKYILPLLAKIFSPLVFITLVIFLISILFTGSNPFVDREFLIIFNVILVLVLGVTVFSVIERNENSVKDIFDYVNIGLLIIALLINVVALSAIIFRLTSYGITPNRLAIILMNIVVFIHLILITIPYMKFILNFNPIELVDKAITKYVVVYGIWATLVILLFPLLF
jgi:hypothetical protein